MKDIPNYNGKYQVNEYGEVYSTVINRLLKPYLSKRGYYVVNLSKKLRPVHQLVAETFIDSEYKSKGLVVDHIDRNKTNNDLINLRLVNKRDNFLNSDIKRKGHYHKRGARYRAIRQFEGLRESKTFDTITECKNFLDEI